MLRGERSRRGHTCPAMVKRARPYAGTLGPPPNYRYVTSRLKDVSIDFGGPLGRRQIPEMGI